MDETPRERFERNSREGEEARLKLYAYLKSRGHEVIAPEQSLAPTWESRGRYADKGDINIRKDGRWYRLEVKRNMRWDGARWPKLKYAPIIGKPYRLLKPLVGVNPLYAVFIFDQTLTRMLMIPHWSREHWYEAEGVSKTTGQRRNKDVAVMIDPENIDERWYRSI